MTHVRITREQATRLSDTMNAEQIDVAELTKGKDGRLSATAIEFTEKRKRLALTPKHGQQEPELDTALGSRAASQV